MKEGFFGLNVAIRGLYSAQRGLDIVNHNINNVNTPGYSRQKIIQTASTPMPLYDGSGMIGTGSEVVGVERVRDEYLDYKYWSENTSYGEWSAKNEMLRDIEVTFNEPSNSGFSTTMNEFFDSLQELAKDPASEAVRALVREKGVTLAKYFNSTAAHFEKLQDDANYRIQTKVNKVNSLANQIQQLNRQIYTTELDGNAANDLRDQRTLLVDQLSSIVSINANEVSVGKLPSGKDDKRFTVSIGGKYLVNHFNASKLSMSQRDTKLNEEDISGLYGVQWEDGNELIIKGGELKGYIDIRDGNNGQNGSPSYKGIPYYINKMNEFVRTFAMAFNEGYIDANNDGTIQAGEDSLGHADGYMGESASGDQPGGIRFFTFTGDGSNAVSSSKFIGSAASPGEIMEKYKQITARNFSVGEDIISDIHSISVSTVAGEVGNIGNLNALIEKRHDTAMFAEGKPEDFMKSLIASLGIDSQQAVQLAGNQKNIVTQVDNQRLSESGVSVDEEMSNLVKYQHAYNAAAQMITTMAEIYDTQINKVGAI